MLKTKLLGATAAAEALAIEDVFSTYLYTGTGAAQTITNGIDLAGEGGLVWIKRRDDSYSHVLYDTARGVNLSLSSNTTAGNVNQAPDGVSAFGATGFSLNGNSHLDNNTTGTYASWTFRKAPRFFDVGTITFNGSGVGSYSHNLGMMPGVVILKLTNTTGDWFVWHRDLTSQNYAMFLNDSAAQSNQGGWATYTSTTVTFDSSIFANDTAVVYLFAHDPLGPSGDGSDGLIACGSYTGNGSTTGPSVSLGWEPQWVMIKKSSDVESWYIYDSMRGVVTGAVSQADRKLLANATNLERGLIAADPINFGVTGFNIGTTDNELNNSGDTYIYIAIRRGPMREPTSGTEVFNTQLWTGTATVSTDTRVLAGITGYPTDLFIGTERVDSNTHSVIYDRMRGSPEIYAVSSGAETTSHPVSFDYQSGLKLNTWLIHYTGRTYAGWNFRRAPGFFDVVAYTGNGVAGRTVSHNLGVAPELIIVKKRSGGTNRSWVAWHNSLNIDDSLYLNLTGAVNPSVNYFNGTLPTSSDITLSTNDFVNGNTYPYIAYLFATLPGISKVGSYTGNGSSQTINCGFTGGARFVLIKRTDSTGDWYVWDTARGIVSGNDPHLSLNTTAAEVTSDDTIDPDSSGFIVNQVAATNVNVSSASYIFYAVA